MPHLNRILLLLPALGLGVLPGCACEDDAEVPVINEIDPPEPTPPPVYNRGYWLDMELDANGRVWLAYMEKDATGKTVLWGARGDGDPAEFTHWEVDGQGANQGGIILGSYDGGHYASIALDSTGVAHFAHHDIGDDDEVGRLMYATGTGGGEWTTAEVEGFGMGLWASIGLVNDTPLIAHYRPDQGNLRVATNASGAWEAEQVDAGDIVTQGDDDDSAPSPPTEVEADVGQYADLLVASDGTAWIAYYDATNGDLKVARGGFGNWTTSVAWAEGDVGAWPSLSEHEGTIYVAFQDVENYDLLFGALASEGTLSAVEIVDAGEFRGADSSVAWIGGEPVIAYQDAVNNDVMLASRAADEWTITQHIADGAVGFHNNLAVGSDGRLNLSVFDHSTNDIVFQRFEP